MENRQTGYYWVVIDGEQAIAKWNNIGRIWKVEDMALPWEDSQFDSINETPIQSPDADNTERGERPSIKDYFPESFGVMDILPIYESQPELFNYAKALDRYIDDIENPTPPTLLNELRENADTDSAILDALSTILQVGASMATNGISDEISEWDLPKTTPIKAKRKIVKEAEKWNDVNRKRAIELKNAYDVLSRSYHNRPL